MNDPLAQVNAGERDSVQTAEQVTLGPWIVDEWDACMVVGAPFEDGGRPRVAECGQADARLIAAAPDLLAALRVARGALAKAGHHDGLSGPLMEVDAAIAKADINR